MNDIIQSDQVENLVITIRNERVLLDSDVAMLYGVETKRINEAVSNNPDKFPEGYILTMDLDEFKALRSKILILEEENSTRSKFSTLEEEKAENPTRAKISNMPPKPSPKKGFTCSPQSSKAQKTSEPRFT